jgi:hypothetical protein
MLFTPLIFAIAKSRISDGDTRLFLPLLCNGCFVNQLFSYAFAFGYVQATKAFRKEKSAVTVAGASRCRTLETSFD